MSKKIVLHSIEFENFLSFIKKQKFSFQSNGIHFIKGENRDMSNDPFADEVKETNGVGKSSILRAIDFVLFGENPNKKIKIDSLINKTTKKNTLVSIEFNIEDDFYRVERYRKYSGKGSGLSLLKKENNIWKDISFSDVRVTQEKINEIISMNHDTFLFSILITKESTINFIESPSYQRSILLENIVRLDKLREYTKRVKENMARDRKSFDFYEKEFYAKTSTISSFSNSIKKNIQNKRTLKDGNTKRLIELKKELSTTLKGSDLNELESFVSFVKLSNELKIKESQLLKNKSKVSDLLKNIKKILKNIKELESKNSCTEEQCSHCDKKINKGIDRSIQNSILLSRSTLADTKTQTLDLLKQSKELRDSVLLLKEETKDKKFLIDKEIKKLIIDEILSGGSGLSHFVNLDHLKTEIQKLESFKTDISDIKEQRSHIRELNIEKQKCSIEKERLSHLLKIGEFWDSSLDFRNEGSLKNYIMAKIVPIFNSFLSSMVDIIFEGSMTIVFDNSWNESIIFNGEEYDYNQLSLGEKAKINLCISLSLFSLMRINVGGMNVLFLDEMFSSIDESGIGKFIEILKSSFTDEIGVYIISHEKGMSSVKTDSVIKVIKENGESFIKT
jgi:DNA repair exonuclease SbcCD ATPase subunit